jgi:hypothetical protein
LPLETAQALERVLDRVDGFLKDDLLRDLLECLAGEPATVPRNRTSPVRPPSAIATACFLLATSKATKTSLCFPMLRPPCMRLGSVRPSNPCS